MAGSTGIKGKQIKDDTVESVDIKDDTIQLVDVKDEVLDADNHSFDPTGSDFDPTIDTVGKALRALDQVEIDALTEFEAFSDDTLESTTSDGWVTKANYPFTTTSKSAGRYVIDFTASIATDTNNREVGVRFQYRFGTTGAWLDLFSDVYDLAKSNSFLPVTAFKEVTIVTARVIDIRIQWGQTATGGVGSIKNAAVKVGKVAGS